MTTRRRSRGAKPDAPITGVAGGSLGTAANLDDTQVFSTAELLAAAPETAPEAPVAAPAVAPAAHEAVPDAATLESAPTAAYPVQVSAVRAAARDRRRETHRLPAMAGLVVVLVLALVAGAGILSTLDFGAADLPALNQPSSEVGPTAPPATPKPKGKEGKEGKGHGGCHGHGCHGANED
jgi:hypothetical protein